MTALRTVPTALNQIAGNGGTLDKLNTQQIAEARNGVTVDPTSSVGQGTGRITVAPSAHDCARARSCRPRPAATSPSSRPAPAASSARSRSPSRGSAAPTPRRRTLRKASTTPPAGVASARAVYSFTYTFDAVGDIYTVTLLDRGLQSGIPFDTHHRLRGGQASQFKFYFSDGYEVAVGYDGIFANSAGSGRFPRLHLPRRRAGNGRHQHGPRGADHHRHAVRSVRVRRSNPGPRTWRARSVPLGAVRPRRHGASASLRLNGACSFSVARICTPWL